jgi:aryl-alcohol dehydrogenase-like predicted oxidoreductase
MLDAFFEQGGNFVDTAHVYNDWVPGERSRSEKMLGAWMKERRNRSGVLVATKGSHPDLAQMEVGRLSPAEIRADLEESLRFLQVETIDLYWLHRDDPTRPVEEIMEALETQARAGKIRYFGCSNWRLERIQAAQRCAATLRGGACGFAGVQNLWSLAKPNLAEIMRRDPTLVVMDDDLWQYHKQTGLAAIPYTSQANGLFQKMDAGGKAALPADLAEQYLSPETEGRYQRLKLLGQQTGLSTTQIGLGFLAALRHLPGGRPAVAGATARLPDCRRRGAHAGAGELPGGCGLAKRWVRKPTLRFSQLKM